MQEIQHRSKSPRSFTRHAAAKPGSSRPRYILFLLYALVFLPTSLTAAFESISLFYTATGMHTGIVPPAMNNPSCLPEQTFWMSVGHGRPMGLDWAAYKTTSVGGAWKSTRGALGIWTSGDKLYSERITSVALSQVLKQRFTAGLAVAYYAIDIQDYPDIRGQMLLDGAVATELSTNVMVSVWYCGQTVSKQESYDNPVRQFFQLAITGRISSAVSGTIALEKTPPFTLRQRAEITIASQREFLIYLGYRTAPETPSLGLQVPMGRMNISFRLIAHPILGLSTAFGLVVK